MSTIKYLDELTYQVIGSCIEVHKSIGPGLLESIYHKCLEVEFQSRMIGYESELIVPIQFKGIKLDSELRCDFLINGILTLEIKSVQTILPVHEAQLLTYMKLLNSPKGILVNFNSYNLFKDGQKTYVNNLYENLPLE